MQLYEFESKELFAKHGISVPEGQIVSDAKEITRIGVLKAQVLVSRSRARGIQITDSLSAAKEVADEMLERGLSGYKVNKVLVEDKLDVKKEYYFAISFDFCEGKPVVLACSHGGKELEKNLDKVQKIYVEPLIGLQEWASRQLLLKAGFDQKLSLKAAPILSKLYNVFKGLDAKLVEMNPLVETMQGDLIAADARIELDDNAMFRHPQMAFAEREPLRKLNERELAAKKIESYEQNSSRSKYIEFGEGEGIGIITTAGGTALANLDSLIEFGGKPACYLELEGSPPAEKIYQLTKIMLSKPGLEACLHVGHSVSDVNIETTMQGFCDALKELKPPFPVIVRRAGQNEVEALKLLKETKEKEKELNLIVLDKNTSMRESARIAVEKAKEYWKEKR